MDTRRRIRLIGSRVLQITPVTVLATSVVMPKYMVPKHVRFVPALPLTPTNKVEKYKLKQQLMAELGKAPRTVA